MTDPIVPSAIPPAPVAETPQVQQPAAPKAIPYGARRPAPVVPAMPSVPPAAAAPKPAPDRARQLDDRKSRRELATLREQTRSLPTLQAELESHRVTLAGFAENQLAACDPKIAAAVRELHPKDPRAQLQALNALAKHGVAKPSVIPVPSSTVPTQSQPQIAPNSDPDVLVAKQYDELVKNRAILAAKRLLSDPQKRAAIERGHMKLQPASTN